MKPSRDESLASEPQSPISRQERTMREAVFVSYARTGLAKAGRGGFNVTPAMSMAAHAISSAVERAGVEPEAVEDVALGNGGHGAGNLGPARRLLAGLPVTTGGATIQRHCSSGSEPDRRGRELHQDRQRRRRRRRRSRVHHRCLAAAWEARRTSTRSCSRCTRRSSCHDRDRRHRRRALRREPASTRTSTRSTSQQRMAAVHRRALRRTRSSR